MWDFFHICGDYLIEILCSRGDGCDTLFADMYLRRLELQGFKTFAQKTIFSFSESGGPRGLTGIVGPNGSGKSNVADAIRWVMGEQSMKLLRGKKSEDVIFSGSEKRARSGFAEVTLALEHEGSSSTLHEVVITRRLYRDGQSEYAVNGQSARLGEVVMLLAQNGVGQRTYSVIGQGMADAILSATPAERKEFFDEAAGLKPFQLKKTQAINKLDATRDHLRQAELVLGEILPRLSSLERQAKRLLERKKIEQELAALTDAYYGNAWKVLQQELARMNGAQSLVSAEATEKTAAADQIEFRLTQLEKATPPSEGFREIRAEIDTLGEERARLRERQMKLESSVEVAKIRAEKPWSPLPLSKIIERLETIRGWHEQLEEELRKKDPSFEVIRKIATDASAASVELVGNLQRPAPEALKGPEVDQKLSREIAEMAEEMSRITREIADSKQRMESWNKQEETKRSEIFAAQHELSAARRVAQAAGERVTAASVELARVESKQEAFLRDIRLHVPEMENELSRLAQSPAPLEIPPEAAAARLGKLRGQLEWIGGIDPEIVKEYESTKTRATELQTQIEDLKQAMASLDTIIGELETTIRDRSSSAFRILDREFSAFFKKLFQGGEAKLIEVAAEPALDEEGNIVEDVSGDAGPAGIDIQATPPGKRLKSIALLSGGERALTSIALICAIMATNPSPFIVLDEVDAALDESNSKKYAEILESLAHKTQFIVVTHNRATMHAATALYGVTMGDDGVSQILSVSLSETKAT